MGTPLNSSFCVFLPSSVHSRACYWTPHDYFSLSSCVSDTTSHRAEDAVGLPRPSGHASQTLASLPNWLGGYRLFYGSHTPRSLIQWLRDVALDSRFLTDCLVFLFNKTCFSSPQHQDSDLSKQTNTNPQGHTQTHSLTSCRHQSPNPKKWWRLHPSEDRLSISRKTIP